MSKISWRASFILSPEPVLLSYMRTTNLSIVADVVHLFYWFWSFAKSWKRFSRNLVYFVCQAVYFPRLRKKSDHNRWRRGLEKMFTVYCMLRGLQSLLQRGCPSPFQVFILRFDMFGKCGYPDLTCSWCLTLGPLRCFFLMLSTYSSNFPMTLVISWPATIQHINLDVLFINSIVPASPFTTQLFCSLACLIA